MGAVWVLDTAAWVFKASEKKTNKPKKNWPKNEDSSHFLPDFFPTLFKDFGGQF